MWRHYGQYKTIVEKEGLSSEQASDNTNDIYVLNDISTFFTILVGIFFPSVTGISNLNDNSIPFLCISSVDLIHEFNNSTVTGRPT